MSAVNWNKLENAYNLEFWEQNVKQFWTDTEIPISDDKNDWIEMSEEQKTVYKHALGGLTLLDTKQGGEGIPLLLLHADNLQTKAILSFMGMMEEMHAKSYSTIFTTLESQAEIDKVFNWVEENELLKKKAGLIVQNYNAIFRPDIKLEDLWKAMAASVLLESYLFYSGFYYPIYLAGHGKMTNSGEIINLILRDESIHGIFIGLKAQELFNTFSIETQKELKDFLIKLIIELYENEEKYTEELYSPIGLADDVKNYVKYNANRALMNLGFEAHYDVTEESFSPIILNGISTLTKNHDFFSKKGNGYVISLNVQPLRDEDFLFEGRL